MMAVDVPAWATLACLLAALLILLAIRAAASGAPRLLRACAVGGGGLLAGVTLVMQSAMELAPLATTVLLGAAVGLVAIDKAERIASGLLIAGVQGLAGLAIMATAAAIHWDPQAIGLADPMAQTLWPDSRLAIAVAMALGAGIGAGSLIAGMRSRGRLAYQSARRRPCLALTLILLIASGTLIGWFCRAPNGVALWSTAMLAAAAGGALLSAAADDELPSAQALLAALGGLAAAVLGFPMHSIAMVVIGGGVSGGGAMLSARLWGRAPLSRGSLSS